jgi:hypothetical protein
MPTTTSMPQGISFSQGSKQMAIDAFDDGYEAFAIELMEFLRNYEEDDLIPVSDIEEFINLSLGWEPEEE